jgi:hypothetical protein
MTSSGKTNDRSSCNPAIVFLGIYPKECELGYYKGTCILVFTVAQFTIAKPWIQSRHLTTDEWIKRYI